MALGLFSVQGTNSVTPRYEITSPVFDEITIKLDPKYYSGKTFKIRTHNNSKENIYIQKSKINDQEFNRYWIGHDEFKQGGVLELWLDSQPNTSWGAEK